jgi:hypothetical protein
MSETEHHKGKLTPTGKTISGFMADKGEMPSFYDNVDEWFSEEFSLTHAAHKLVVYEIEKESIDPYDDVMMASENEDGTIDFEVKYYNGGCCFSEAIETSLNLMDKA